MKSDIFRITVKDKAVRDALAKLPERVSENVRKRAARRALRPFVKELARLWVSARLGRDERAAHRRAIGAATILDVRRNGAGPTAPTRVRVGVDYRRKYGRLQKVWHLIESGFNHKTAKRRVKGRFISLSWAKGRVGPASTAVSRQMLIEAKKALEGGK